MADSRKARGLIISVVLLFGCAISTTEQVVEQVTKPETLIGMDLGTTYSCVITTWRLQSRRGGQSLSQWDRNNAVGETC
ncbi:Endoplasmic reticulum chaperone BiP [Linum perenne]